MNISVFCQLLLAIMAGHKANIRKLMTEKPWHKRPKILPILAEHPLLKAPVVQRNVVVEQHLVGEPILEPLVVLTLDSVTIYLHRPPSDKARTWVGFFKVDPSFLCLEEAQ